MAPLTNSTARVVDPVLSQFTRGYRQAGLIAEELFPRAYVPVRGFKTIRFGKESFRRYQTRRSPGTATKRITYGYESDPAKLYQHALDAVVPREHVGEAEAGPGINLKQGAARLVMDVMQLDAEIQAAELATNEANYGDDNKDTLSGSDQWDHADSKPKDVIKEGKEAVRKRIGREPNKLILPKPVFNALDDHPALLEKLKYTSSDNVTAELLARYFGVSKVVVADGVFADSNDDDDDFTDVWGNFAILAYVPEGERQDVQVPSFGYTYTLEGHPFAEVERWDADSKSWINGITDERSAEFVGSDAGYLISDVLGG
ncbi:MAG: major capsid protein [Parvibaculum sp.]|uniref:major capsid protein n=1 Tax=Parvibaculum sp. TaxID=2024848 RepID=UPI00271ED2E5|nr:major capsid protein [Parvibaculum sp.]MDO8838014.1 major capsid protein [Parvibaculum sp.]